ncbi:hypothetical protein [Waltera sp.]
MRICDKNFEQLQYAVFTADDTDPEKVRERADEDMYRNKKAMKQS